LSRKYQSLRSGDRDIETFRSTAAILERAASSVQPSFLQAAGLFYSAQSAAIARDWHTAKRIALIVAHRYALSSFGASARKIVKRVESRE